MESRHGQSGIALVAVLWALVLLSLVTATVLTESRSQGRMARNLLDAAQAEALADGGVHRAMAGLAKSVRAGGLRVDGTVYLWRRPQGEVRFLIEDEGGKIDLNRAGKRLFENVFIAVGVEEAQAGSLADALLDFRDGDSARRPFGAEDGDYRAAGLPNEAKDAPFDALEELHQVFGMTRSIYLAVSHAFTVHSRRRRPDRNLASPLVLAAYKGIRLEDLPEREVENDDRDGASASFSATEPEIHDPNLSVLRLGPSARRSRARTYTIHSEARTRTGAKYVRRAIVRLTGRGSPPYQILTWDRGESELFSPVSP